jgi:YVTN family beta-propeller protein
MKDSNTCRTAVLFLIAAVCLSIAGPARRSAAQTGSGSLKVTSFPSGANVLVDGVDTGKVTPMSVSLPVGDHSVVVSIPNSGWNSDTRTVTIVAGNNDLSVTLLPVQTTGPQGPKGDKGDKGDTGSQGPTGPQGLQGPAGVDGVSPVGQPEPAGSNCQHGGLKYTDAQGMRYVCNGAPGGSQFDSLLLGMLRWDRLPTGKAITVGASPSALAFDGTFVYVANQNSNDVTRIRASTGMVEGSPIPVGASPRALAFDGTFVYVANQNSDDVTRIRASTGMVEGSPIPVGDRPVALTFDESFIYVANVNSNNVTRIRASTGIVDGSPIPVGTFPNALAFDGTFVYVANAGGEGSVTRIQASTGMVERNIGVFEPRALAFDGTFIYAAEYQNGRLYRISASTGGLAGPGSILVGTAPVALVFDGTFIYTAHEFSDSLTRIRASTGMVEGSPIPAGDRPVALAFDGTFIYVATANDDKVTRFRP